MKPLPPRPTILVVDDEPEVLHSVRELLRHDYRVLTAERGDDALKLIEEDDRIEVILSDQRMPGMSGSELFAHARRIRPLATRLIFTAYSDLRAVIDAINQGHVFRYIAKPWDTDELQVVLRQAVEQHRLLAENAELLATLKATNERLREANAVKGAFIEVASHELNTPVAVVLGMTQLWKMTQAPTATDAERGWVDRIQNAGKRLAATVERMLKLLRSDAFSNPMEVQKVPLRIVVEESVAMMAPYLSARKQSVELELDPELGEAEIDRSKIGDVLQNLLVNAIKFTPDGGRIRVQARAPDSRSVRFAVIDEGIGIDFETKAHLFEPFFTGFDTLHHSSGEFEFGKRGMGLGLSLVKRFVELHGGEVDVQSIPGVGSSFGFTLPRHQRSALEQDFPRRD